MASPDAPVVALLERARDLVKGGWTQTFYARTAEGRPTVPIYPTAVKFCPVGAMIRARWALRPSPVVYDRAIERLIEALPPYPSRISGTRRIEVFNDTRWPNKDGKREVLALFKRAIGGAKA